MTLELLFFNFPLFRIFADPMNTAGLVIDPNMAGGFKFEVLGVMKNEKVVLKCPEETYELIALIGTTERYVISRITRAKDNIICAANSTTKLTLIAGKYVGKDDPVSIVRAQHGLPAVGEILARGLKIWVSPVAQSPISQTMILRAAHGINKSCLAQPGNNLTNQLHGILK